MPVEFRVAALRTLIKKIEKKRVLTRTLVFVTTAVFAKFFHKLIFPHVAPPAFQITTTLPKTRIRTRWGLAVFGSTKKTISGCRTKAVAGQGCRGTGATRLSGAGFFTAGLRRM